MKIFKDIITGDEMFTDSFKYTVIDDCLYEVECKHVTRKQGEVLLEGFNPSAEEGCDENADDCVESGLDIVLNQRLAETAFSKKDFMNYVKTYAKELQNKWKELEWTEDQITEAKAKLTDAVKKVAPKLNDCQFFLGESMNPDGMVALCEYRDDKPVMMFFKHGLEEEKV
ncbi:translationally-controlled tumor protein homolog [Limulus polyphemus]|uniref:Translationally-controlled tumor protein homolog n=1 Tax=Limulus polyphemus TaxID=6850 RepID=A0ABM1B055_LIMPO|nr:translationally-controlled tumor protein homolog [Limulus polyphemus]